MRKEATANTLRIVLVLTLGLAACLQLGFNLRIGLERDDTENLESTLVLVSARQLTGGFAGLYGPFSGANPRVLIHAPLYYRLTGLLAWPLTRVGVDPIDACRAAGRLISLLSLVGCLAVAARMTSLDGSSPRAGLWAALLVASTPLLGSFPVSMRPDMLGVFLQTLGLWLVLGVLFERGERVTGRLVAGHVAFALALCVKQHYIVAPAFATLLLVPAVARRRVPIGSVALAWSAGVATAGLYLGGEEWLTAGRMSHSVFVLPGWLKAIAAGSWDSVRLVFVTALKRGIGLCVLGLGCAVATSRASRGRRLDAVLAVYIGLELALMAKLCLNSIGGWYNYAVEAALVSCVLLARALERIAAADLPLRRLIPVGAAALALLAAEVRLFRNAASFRAEAAADLARLEADASFNRHSPAEVYFPGAIQHYNIRYGRGELTHDEWLYRAFEAIGAAERRQAWLQPVLETGPVRVVVMPDGPNAAGGLVEGLDRPLPALGYVLVARAARFTIWERPAAPPITITRRP